MDGAISLNKSLLECVASVLMNIVSNGPSVSKVDLPCSRGIFLGESCTLMQLLERDELNSLSCLTTEPRDTIRYFIVLCLFLMCHIDTTQLQYIHQNVHSPAGPKKQKFSPETFTGLLSAFRYSALSTCPKISTSHFQFSTSHKKCDVHHTSTDFQKSSTSHSVR